MDSELTQASLNQLIQLTGIKRVVCVDDNYAEFNVENVIGICARFPDKARATKGLRGVSFDKPRKIWSVQLRGLWSKLPDKDRERVYQTLRGAVGSVKEDDQAASALSGLFANLPFQTFSLRGWNSQKDSFISSSRHKKTLYLFDQDFRGEGKSETEGIKLIAEMLPVKGAICGLLSHRVNLDTEYRDWTRIAEDHHLDKDRFLVISKQRLTKPDKYDGFVRMLKLVALAAKCAALKKRTATVIRSSLRAALARLDSLHIFDFENMVFTVSQAEGVWEPDTLFRLFGIYQRLEARELAKGDLQLQELVNRVRAVSDIKIRPAGVAHTSCWEVQRLELYEEADYINKYYMPIDLGDIFEKTPGGKQFILIAQPCELMVRPDGKRAPAVSEATLLEMVPSGVENPVAFYELRHYNLDSGDSVRVSFNRKHIVKLCVLDMCAYQPDGAARLALDEPCPSQVIPAWKAHHEKLKEELTGYIARYERLDRSGATGDVLKEIRRLAHPVSSNDNIFKARIDLNPKQISFGLRRIRRLSQSHSAALLTQFGNYSSRSAFDVDLAR